jgi:hypothetical protein
MATCYHCAAHIAPGEGVRRDVTTSRQSRTWVSSRPGGSYGVTSGLRTLCASCAHQLDQSKEGSGVRGAVLLIGWAISALLGVRWGVQDKIGGLLMLFLLFGGPAWIAFGVMGWMHDKDVQARSQASEQASEQGFDAGGVSDHTRPDPPPLAAEAPHVGKDADSDESLLVEPYPGVGVTARYVAKKLEDLGIALLPCNGHEQSLDGYRRLLREWVRRYPVDDFAGLQAWGDHVYGVTLERFHEQAAQHLQRLGACLEAEEVNQDDCWAALQPLLEILPLKPDEELAYHWLRANEVLAQVEYQLASWKNQPDETPVAAKAQEA